MLEARLRREGLPLHGILGLVKHSLGAHILTLVVALGHVRDHSSGDAKCCSAEDGVRQLDPSQRKRGYSQLFSTDRLRQLGSYATATLSYRYGLCALTAPIAAPMTL